METSGSSPINGLVAVTYDFNDSITPTSMPDVLAQGNRQLFQALSTDRALYHYNFKTPTAGSNTAIIWYQTSLPGVTGSIKFASTFLTPSRDYCEIIIDLYVQFRGRV